jgi:hypothetical protein
VIYDGLVLFEEPLHGLPAGQPKQRPLDPSVVHTAPDLSTARLGPEQRKVPVIGPLLHRRPARLSTLAGTPTSRSAATVIPLRFAHEAATFRNASSSSGSRAAWSI